MALFDATTCNWSWKQAEDEEAKDLEFTTTVILPADAKPREVTAFIKDSDILAIEHKGASLLQWRLHDNVDKDITHNVTADGTVTVGMQKSQAAPWPCFRNQPIADNDDILLSDAALDKLLASELLPLPPADAAAAEKKPSESAADPEDIDALLDEAVEEVAKKEHQTMAEKMVEAETEALDREAKEIAKTLSEMRRAPVEGAEKAELERKIAIVETMQEVSNKSRRLRSQPTTVATFEEVLDLDIKKALLNSGNADGEEKEEWLNPSGASMKDTEVLTDAINALQSGDNKLAFHLLRANALNNNHSVSVCLLHRLYMERQQPAKAGFFVRRQAKVKPADPAAQLLLAEMFDRGIRHFPPLFAMAVKHFQAAAKTGNVHAMLSLAQLFKSGATSMTMVSESAAVPGNADEARSEKWLAAALERGSGSAYFVRACMHLTGEGNAEKSHVKAANLIERVQATSPSVLKRAPGVMDKLKLLEAEQTGKKPADDGDASKPPVRPSVGTSSLAKTTAANTAGPKPAPVGDDNTPSVSASNSTKKSSTATSSNKTAVTTRAGGTAAAAKRLEALSGGSGGNATQMMDQTSSKQGMLKKRANWGPTFERFARWGAGLYFVYVLAFPLRIALMGPVFSIVAMAMESMGLQPANQGGQHPMMGMM